GDEPTRPPLQRRVPTLRARQPRDRSASDAASRRLPRGGRAGRARWARGPRGAVPPGTGSGLSHRRVCLRGRRGRRVHAVREPWRGGVVLSAPDNPKILVRDATKIYETKTGPVH